MTTDTDDGAADGDEDAVVLDQLEITSYQVSVEVLTDEYDGLENLKADVRATAANTILDHVDSFWLDDVDAHRHVEEKVEFDDAQVEREFELGEADVLRVETVTELGRATEGQS